MNPNRYHTFGQRLGAAIIDGFVFVPVSIIGEAVFGGHSFSWTIMYNLIYFTYSIYMHGRYGQTLGKMATHVKVVRNTEEDQLIGYQGAFIRDSIVIVLVLLDILLALFGLTQYSASETLSLSLGIAWVLAELVTMLFNKKRRAVHDLLAGSVVIDVTKHTEWEKKVMSGEI